MSKSKRCSGCQNLEDTLDEVVQASLKHQKAATDLKDTVKNQKIKIQEFREANSKLYDDIGSLESDIKDNDDFLQKVVKARNGLQNEVSDLKKKNRDLVEENNEVIEKKQSTR